jgi:hypothetical protein
METTSTDIDLDGGAERLVFDTTTNERLRQELAHRTADGIEVRLLWSDRDDTIAVEVFDRDADDLFELEVARDRALDAF